MENLTCLPGKPLPLGATCMAGGVNFSVFSRNGTAVFLELFRNAEDSEPYALFELDPDTNKTGDLWHAFIPDIGKDALYLYRVDGPFRPNEGFRFNVHKYLIDPYARCLTSGSIFRDHTGLNQKPPHIDVDLAYTTTHTAAGFPKCVVVDNNDFDWQGDRPLNYHLRHSILYEAHVKGLTVHPSSGVANPGTYRGIIDAIPRLRDLGITSLELLPVQEFDEHENPRSNPDTGEQLTNYWGYSTVAFFAPKNGYASERNLSAPVNEFKLMVRELHKAGIEVILDIVFNHTAEGNERGITMSFRGFDNSVYYMLENNKRYYRNFTGCGNTVNCNHPVVQNFILDCLRYWVTEMHVDGFRFDLGSVLGRDQNGKILDNPPTLERIAEDPVLRRTKIIAEAWDAGGAYQVGGFPGGRWAEWNDRYRDDVRLFWRGDTGMTHHFATRLTGSSDLYLRNGRKPFHSVNFVTAHDGFTLNDLVSYNGKHNEENGENNRDGSDHNNSYNYGAEGPAKDPSIETLRVQQIKNFHATLLLSLGTPMLLMGDEMRRSQGGNNNAYCQDNEVSWMDWSLADKNHDILRFVRCLAAFRRRHAAFMRPDFLTGQGVTSRGIPDITWFNAEGRPVDWGKTGRFIAYRLMGARESILADRDDNDFYLIFNASARDVTVTVSPPVSGKEWFRVIDTARVGPDDILEPGKEAPLPSPNKYIALARSTVVLITRIV